jgi:hypothetical protein
MTGSKKKKKEKSNSLSIFLLNRTFSDKSFLNKPDDYADKDEARQDWLKMYKRK